MWVAVVGKRCFGFRFKVVVVFSGSLIFANFMRFGIDLLGIDLYLKMVMIIADLFDLIGFMIVLIIT